MTADNIFDIKSELPEGEALCFGEDPEMGAWKATDFTDADETFRARFWSKVDVRGPAHCWEWRAYRKPGGYGQFTIRKGHFMTASRVALALVEPLEAGEVACHKCDNPPCCNPRHLFRGTQSDNVRDSVRKGRANRATGTGTAIVKLTPDKVLEIRSRSDESRKALAEEFGVSSTTIRRIIRREIWRSVP